MFSNNEQFQKFCYELDARGIFVRALWSAKRSCHPVGAKVYDDVAMFEATSNGTKARVAVSTFIVVDYGPDGFGLWLESGSIEIAADVDRIAPLLDPPAPICPDLAPEPLTESERDAFDAMVPPCPA